MVKNFKRILSALLAVIMCLPSGLVTVANAATAEQGGEYTVTLADSEYGIVQFSEKCMNESTATQEGYNVIQVGDDGQMNSVENDGSIWAFRPGDTVEIEVIPQTDYRITSFSVNETETGDILSKKETKDNVFSFSMPGKNIAVNVEFEQLESDKSNDAKTKTAKKARTASNEEDGGLWIKPESGLSIFVRSEDKAVHEGVAVSYTDGKVYVSAENTTEYEEVTDELNEDGYLNVDNYLEDSDEDVVVSYIEESWLILNDVDLNDVNGKAVDIDIEDEEDGWGKINISQQESPQYLSFDTSVSRAARAVSNVTATDDLNNQTLELTREEGFGQTEITYLYKMHTSTDPFNAFCFDPAKSAPSRGKTDKKEMKIYELTMQNFADAGFSKSLIDGVVSAFNEEEALLYIKALFATCCIIGNKANDHDGTGSLGGTTSSSKEYQMWYKYISRATDYSGDSSTGAVCVRFLHVLFALAGHTELGDFAEWYNTVQNKPLVESLAKEILDYAKENRSVLEHYKVYIGVKVEKGNSDISGADNPFQRMIFVQRESRDPIGLYLYKAGTEGKDTLIPEQYKNLSGAQFEVKYYPKKGEVDGNTNKEARRKANCFYSASEAATYGKDAITFVFETGHKSKGSADFKYFLNRKNMNYGIDMFPKDKKAILWQNDFIIEGREEYATTFGYPGTYVIYEIKPPSGYKDTGEMSFINRDGTKEVLTTNITEGIAVWVDKDEENLVYKVNGKISSSGMVGAGVTLGVEDEPDTPTVRTDAVCLDTGTQILNPNKRSAQLRDSITVYIPKTITTTTRVETKLITLDGRNVVPVKWKERDGVKANGNTAIKVFSSGQPGVNSGADYTYNVECTLDNPAQYAGKTLIFINTVYVKSGTDPEWENGWNSNKTEKLWHKEYGIETVTVTDADGNEVQQENFDYSEMIFVTNGNTSIISDQTLRKGTLKETIGYAGMYKDDTYQSGGGSIKQTFTDTVNYSGLNDGETYTIIGKLIDLETMQYAVDAHGTPIQNTMNTREQKAVGSNGSFKITYSFDATNCGGKKFVSYVSIYRGDECIFSYEDPSDRDETLYLPAISTKLRDAKTGIDVSYAEESVTLIDTISYRNLIPGLNYKIVTKLVNMETKEILKDINGDDVIHEDTFTPSQENGEYDVAVPFAAMVRDKDGKVMKSLAGTTIVAYEYIYVEQKAAGSNKWVLVADHEDFMDKNQRMYFPYIDTVATDQKTAHHISYAEKDMVIYDKVHYESIRPEYTYELDSSLRDLATGEIIKDDSNTDMKKTTEFKAELDLSKEQYLTYGDIIPNKKENKGVWFDVDAESFAGRTLVVFEELYIVTETGRHKLAEHMDLLDELQTIHVPKVRTKAIDSETGTNIANSDGETVIEDTFTYENLIPGLTYKIKGRVVDKTKTVSTGTEVVAVGTNGKPATAEKTFTAEKSSGSEKLSFTIDTSKYGTDAYKGIEFVVYEELYVIDRYDDADHECIVASHTDINDSNQTIAVPYITTALRDETSKTQVLNATENAVFTDAISYFHFPANETFMIKGWLVDMKTGEVLTDTKDARQEKTVQRTTDASGTGKWEIRYEFDATELGGRSVVAFAEVYVQSGKHSDEKIKVAEHKDFWDGSQRGYIPLISTVATDQKTNSHITYAEDNVWITDRIYYSHLEPDTEYILVSSLVDKATNEVVMDDKGVRQEIESTFTTTPNESQEKYNMTISNPFTNSSDTGIGYAYGYVIPADGTTLPDGSKYKGVVFTLDAHTFEGRTLVIYEELRKRTPDGEVTVAVHKDINDENQTIHIPKIRTYLRDSETGTNLSKMDGMITLHDYVAYENLLPGQTYVLEGVLMDKPNSDTKTPNIIKDGDGNPIKGTYEFVPDKPNGTAGPVVLKGNADHFQTDEGEFSSETVVAYERMYLKDRKDASDELLLVASHEDINDENQTIPMPIIRTEVTTYNLGERPKDDDSDHAIGFAAYKCEYCGTAFYTQIEADAHLRQSQICQRKGKIGLITSATIYDKVYYENLIPNRTYTIVGQVIDVRTNKAVTTNNKVQEPGRKSFTPGSSSGEVDVVFHIDNLELAGGRYVVYEELFLDGVSIAEHKERWDPNQTFYVPDVTTSAKATATKSHIANTETDAEIIDTVELSGLKENTEYYIRSALMETTYGSSNYGGYFSDASQKPVQPLAWRKQGESRWHDMDEMFSIPKAEQSESWSGTLTLEVKFVVDLRTTSTGISFEDRSFAVYQELFLANGTLVGQHKDLLDEQQTIYTGGIHTTAVSSSTRGHLMEAASGQWMADTIFYSGFEPGGTYFVTTNVYVKEDSDPVSGVMTSIEPVNQGSLTQAKFVASKSGAGSWVVNISLPDLTGYAGKTLVVYEEIRKGATDGETVAYENDLYNEAQSVHIAGMSTSEKDGENTEEGVHYTRASHKWICNYCEEEFDNQIDAEKHVAPNYVCDNCEASFAGKEEAEAHINGECKKAAVLRDTQLVRDEDGNVKAENWYQCSGCGMRYQTNQECLDHIYGSDICYTYKNANEQHKTYRSGNATVIDTVSYKNLIPGRKYKVEGKIYNVETGEFALDEEGNEITASKTFITYTSTNRVEVEFTFNAEILAGYKYAVYETLYDLTPRYDALTASTLTDPVVIAKHHDPTDKEQIFFIPKLSTQAMDDYTKTNVTRADTTTTIYDTVSFEGLNIGSSDQYEIVGTVMDAQTMQPLVLANGEEATASSGVFTVKRGATGTDLQKRMEFTFSTDSLEGRKLVIFERLYYVAGSGRKTLIGQHTDIMDENQSTYIPMLRTYAYDMETGEQVSGADESVTIVDKVICTNLVKGKRYRLNGKLVDPGTGKTLQDANGHDITGELELRENNYNEFTASNTGRTVKTVKFVFDGSNLKGKTAVVHETLEMQTTNGSWEAIAYHNPLPNVNDESMDMDYRNQRIDFPEIETTAKGTLTGSEFVKAEENAEVTDTVTYKNLTGGLEYKLVGTIYDIKHDAMLEDTFNDTFKAVKYFTADDSGNGTVEMEFSFNAREMAGNSYVVYEELYLNDVRIAWHMDSTDKKQTFLIPEIGTTAASEDLGNKMTNADEDVVIVDTVSFENLIPDREYEVQGILMNKDTKEPLLDGHGDEITAVAKFTPKKASGTVDVQFRFKGTHLAGASIVAYEELFYLGKSIAEHKDPDDEEQAAYLPEITTLAQVNETGGTHVGIADGVMSIKDIISYKNLLGDESYHVHGIVMDAETKEPATDANGDQVTVEAVFQTAHPDLDSGTKVVSGTTEVEYQFDATGMRGKTLVIYEDLYWHKTDTEYIDFKVAKHNDIADKKQMIHIPEIGTTAWDSETRIGLSKADDCATIIDTVSYKNLYPGLEYTLEAKLIDLDNDGEDAVDDYGVPIVSKASFIPKTADGEVEVRFNDLEITSLAGHTLVCFEYLYYDGTLIEHHDDPEDEAQTVHIPRIATTATSYDSESGNAMAEAYINVVDVVEYENLIPGLEYIVKGVVINKATGKPLIDADNSRVESSTTFTPETDCGTVDVVFTFNGKGMEDTDMVVFEEIFYQGSLAEMVSVAEHSDMEDENQSVSIPKISTDIMNNKTGIKIALAEKGMSLTDTVRYSGLVPGTEYELIGKLFDKDTKEPVLDDDGNEIVAVENFTAEEKRGHHAVTFEFDGCSLEGKTLVATEELYVVKSNDELSMVAEHKDLEDADQTIYVPKARTEAADKNTGINYSLASNHVEITDTIQYENLVPGYGYTAKGILVDRETKEPVLDSNNREITAERAFTVSKPDGTVEIKFEFDAEGFESMTYNIFETITCNGKVIAEHKDVNDDKQNVHFPKITTDISDADTELQISKADGEVSITDVIHYENLKPGEEYTMIGMLKDKDTGLPILDPSVNTNPYEVLETIIEHWTCDQCGETFNEQAAAMEHVEASMTDEHETFTLVLSFDADEYKALIDSATIKAISTFTAEEPNGNASVQFDIDASKLAGHTVVAFIRVEYKGKEIAIHEDLQDEAETIYFPEIKTMATDKESGLHVSKADAQMQIKDIVTYKNLITGMEYIMMGRLIDKATGETFVDASGNPVTAETEFSPTEPNGTVEVEFSFDGSRCANRTVVAYEKLVIKHGDNPEVAIHEDIEDAKQTVTIPEISTRAFDALTKENVVKARKETVIIDRVCYNNLEINEVYKVSGVLIDKATGEPVKDKDGNEVRAEKTFTARDHGGYVDLEFRFDAAGIEGMTLVAYEELSFKDHIIADHKDLEDKEQTVYIPKVSTTALDKKSGTHTAYADKEIVIVDSVSYSNVAVGTEYTLTGSIVDGDTGEVLAGPVSEKFTADAESGIAEVEFTVPSESIKGRKVVVFEELLTKFVVKSEEKETYVCNQCGKKFDTRQKAVWHFEDSDGCSDYSVTFETVKTYGDSVVVAEHKDLEDANQTVYVPEIQTEASDGKTGANISYAGDEAVIIDTIKYSGLQPGEEYEVSGMLMDKETGKPALSNGEEVTASKVFVPETSNGEVSTEFHINLSDYAGRDLVAFEELYVEGSLVADHKDIEDEKQTIHVPEIQTSAKDSQTQEHIGPEGESIIVDTVSYKNLIPGMTYTVKGIIMDKETGKPYQIEVSDITPVSPSNPEITPEDPSEVEFCTEETTFIPDSRDGSVTLSFRIKSTKGMKAVVFEELYLNGELVADHKDIEDEEQTVQYPSIRTHATNKDTGNKVASSVGKTIIVDRVTYQNLIPGKEYTIQGTLMDKKTGESTGYTASKTFKAEAADGYVELEFEVDASLLAGKSVVAFETLSYEGVDLTFHEDLTDEDQTVDMPKIETHAYDKLTQAKAVAYGKEVKVIDTVTYKNLVPGEEYEISGRLMLKDKDGVKDIGIQSSVIFTPEEKDGSIELEFTVDSTKYTGMSMVAYETLTYKDKEIAKHEDPEDEAQTVYVPKIGTVAKIGDLKIGIASKKTVITDTVSYENLVPNMGYTITGILMDKETGKKLEIDGKEVTASKTFIPKESSGTVDILFELDTTKCSGMSIVAFEELKLNGTVVAKHEDITDEDQTVGIPEIRTYASDAQTKTKVVVMGSSVTVIDEVSYKGLTPNLQYIIKGELMLKQGSSAVPTGIKAETAFTPTQPNGSVTLKFDVDSTKYAGQSLVAYETLLHNNLEIAKHEDPTDEDQTVYVPTIGTKAAIDGKKKADTSKNTVIVDTVEYQNLVPGIEYVLTGKLVNKANGKVLSIGGKAITASKKFKPSAASGAVEMEFKFDSTACKGLSIVVFEELSLSGKAVAAHADLNDKSQTVSFNKGTETPNDTPKDTPKDDDNETPGDDKNNGGDNPNTNPSKNTSTIHTTDDKEDDGGKTSLTTKQGSTLKDGSKIQNVKTGDDYLPVVAVFMAAIVMLGIAVVIIKKKK